MNLDDLHRYSYFISRSLMIGYKDKHSQEKNEGPGQQLMKIWEANKHPSNNNNNNKKETNKHKVPQGKWEGRMYNRNKRTAI